MTSVTFPFFVGKPREDKSLPFEDAEFRYTTKFARQLEASAGQGIAFVMARGQFVESLVLFVCYGLKWTDKKMNEDKAVDLIDAFIDAGGNAQHLRDACLKALNASGVYGPDETADSDKKDDETDQEKKDGDASAVPLA